MLAAFFSLSHFLSSCDRTSFTTIHPLRPYILCDRTSFTTVHPLRPYILCDRTSFATVHPLRPSPQCYWTSFATLPSQHFLSPYSLLFYTFLLLLYFSATFSFLLSQTSVLFSPGFFPCIVSVFWGFYSKTGVDTLKKTK